MDITLTVIGVTATIIGIVLMVKFKFYTHQSNDTPFAMKFKVFMSGLIICFTGVFILVSELAKFLNK